MVLINVRLDEEDARRAKALRGAGVPISTIVRDAILSEYERRVVGTAGGKAPSALLAEILAANPDPIDMPPREVDVTDRRAVRRHIAERLAGPKQRKKRGK